ncbi:uncharacterized protein [Macrobrachium rosenbergii]|uniref:uncharacterized protein n=1 Tax=Macrobrachium rosenbergii TaxID=79674 RepID=UPI0034D5480B
MESLIKLADSLTLRDLEEKARFFVYAYNSTTLVTTAGLALGVFFISAAILLYIFYYSASTGRSSGGDWEYQGGKGRYRRDFTNALGLLERAWAIYGVEGPECRRRLICEAHLPNAPKMNGVVAGLLTELTSQMRRDLPSLEGQGKVTAGDLLRAATQALVRRDCRKYFRKCAQLSLASLRDESANHDGKSLNGSR